MAKINSRISLLNSATNENKIDFDKLQPLDNDELSSWWRMVPGARRFTNTAADAVDKHCAAAAHLPKVDLEGFVQMLVYKISRRHVSLNVEIFDYDEKGDAEDFVTALTEKFASNFLRDFTKDSPLADLAAQNTFGGYAVIVKLRRKVNWLTSAVVDFNKNSANSTGSIIFVTCEDNPSPSLTRLSDYLTPYDVQFFAINLLENSKLTTQEKLYTSTLAAKLSGQSAILAKNLATVELFTDGIDFVKKIVPNFDNRIFSRAVWECQAQFLLPTLEQLRGQFIEKNFSRLKHILPVKDEFGKILNDPWDMELRHLHFYGGNHFLFNPADWELLELAYHARNDLSHLTTIDLQRLQKLFTFAD
ncbi:MAG: hypothetical protein IJS29_03215 [Selenomonadaceae bacterium]|nr:hypothetical protein [Selenomonadaceae bacterium]